MTDLTIHNGDVQLAGSVFGDPDNPAVLLIHGLSASRDTWEETVALLSDRFHVWTLDLRGHGHSARTDSYLIEGYVSDAAAMLDVIGRPTVVAGHSLGAVVAGVLGQAPHPLVRASFLEDPPWYLGESAEWDKGLYKTIFPMIRAQQVEMQNSGASLTEWVHAVASAPSPKGGTTADHLPARQILSTASARMRHDARAWDTSIDQTLFARHRPDLPIQVPVAVVRADPGLGPAFMEGHDERFSATNPGAEITLYEGATHLIHASTEHTDRFLTDLEAFVTTNASR